MRTLEQPLQNGNSDGISRNDLGETRREYLVEQGGGGHRTAPMNGLRRDIHAQAGGHVRELFETGGGIGSPAIDQGLDQRLWVKFGPIRTLDIAQVRGSRLRGRGEQGLHGLAELWYGRHGRSLGYGV